LDRTNSGNEITVEVVDTHEQIWIKETMIHGKLPRDSRAREQQNKELMTSEPPMAEAWRIEAVSLGHKIVEATWEEFQNAWSHPEVKSSILERPQVVKLDTEVPIEAPEAQELTILAAETLTDEPILAKTAKDAGTVTTSTIQTSLKPRQSLEDVEALQTTHRATGQTAEGNDTDLYLIL
jgi:hypothetical protein